MARPKKARFFDGLELPDNLYPDNKGRENKWRYRRPDGSWKVFGAETEKAIDIAVDANNQRTEAPDKPVIRPQKGTMSYFVDQFIKWREEYDPDLDGKESWRNRKNALRKFTQEIGNPLPQQLDLEILQDWWEAMSYHAQHYKRTEMCRFINYLMLSGRCPHLPFNPFNNDTTAPRLLNRAKPVKRRIRLSLDDFWIIHGKAGEMGYPFLQIAMEVALITTMRRDDICSIRLDHHIEDGHLKKVINKSLNQRGEANATYLRWNLSEHPMLEDITRRARRLSMQNYRCPYLLSHDFGRKVTIATKKQHACQVLPNYLTHTFQDVRNATGIYDGLPDTAKPPTFHEVRALASNLLDKAGYEVKDVKELMAHTDEKITEETYQSGHAIKWTDIHLTLTLDQVKAGAK